MTDTLTEHVQRITSIDWAPNTNRIVTCGAVSNLLVPAYRFDFKIVFSSFTPYAQPYYYELSYKGELW